MNVDFACFAATAANVAANCVIRHSAIIRTQVYTNRSAEMSNVQLHFTYLSSI
jgi:hypothetical protein